MSGWNYRIFREAHVAGFTSFVLHAVWYGDDGSITGITCAPSFPSGHTAADVETETVHLSDGIDAIYFKNTTGRELLLNIEITDCVNVSPAERPPLEPFM